MIEAELAARYHTSMRRATFADILKRSWNDILDSLDVRQQRPIRPLRRGETIERAWLNTGSYLRKAMAEYDNIASKPHTTRSPR